VRFGRDVFDNVVASCFFEEAAEALELRLAIDVEDSEEESLRFCSGASGRPNALCLRGRYRLDHLRVLPTPNWRQDFVAGLEAADAGFAA
jgi:hypothetical protein